MRDRRSIDPSIITLLRRQAGNWNWDNVDGPIRYQVVDKGRSVKLQWKLLLKGTHLTLEKVRQQVNLINLRQTTDQLKGKKQRAEVYFSRYSRGYFSRDSCCPARNAECDRCNKTGHEKCQTKGDRM